MVQKGFGPSEGRGKGSVPKVEDKHDQDDEVKWCKGSVPRGAGWCRKGSVPQREEGRVRSLRSRTSTTKISRSKDTMVRSQGRRDGAERVRSLRGKREESREKREERRETDMHDQDK